MSLEIQTVENVDWVDDFLEVPDRFEEALLHLGVSQEEAARARQLLDIKRVEFQSSAPPEQRQAPLPFRGTMSEGWAKLKRWLQTLLRDVGIRPLLEHEPLEVEIRVPLFILGAPEPPQSEVIYERKSLTEGRNDWKVTVLGSGFSAKQSVWLCLSSTITASAGTTKLIYLPTTFIVRKMGIFEGEAPLPVRTFLQVSPKPPAIQNINAMCEISREEAFRLMGSIKPVGEYRMKDTSGSTPQSYEYRLKLSGEYVPELGFKAFETEIKQTITVKMEQESAVKLKLPEGHDYELLISDRLAGAVCRVRERKL